MAQHDAEEYRQGLEELSATMGKSLEQMNDLIKYVARQQEMRTDGRRGGGVVAPATAVGEMKKRVGKVLEKMATVDKDLDVDIACLAELAESGLLEPSIDFDGSHVTKNGFKQIRSQMDTAESGRHKGMIGSIQDRLAGQAQHNAEQMEADGEDDDDEGFEVADVVVSKKDPLTKELITDPVKNKVCNHVYQKNTILGFIEQHRRARKLCQCPCTACPNKKPLDPKDLLPYPEFLEQ